MSESLSDKQIEATEAKNCNLFVQLFKYIKHAVIDSIKEPFSLDRDRPMLQFEHNLIFLKVMLIFVLLIMSIYFIYNFGPIQYNGNSSTQSFIGPLFGESFLFGLCISLSFLILLWFRLGSKWSSYTCLWSIFIFILIFFLILNLLFEWSGFSDVSLSPLPLSIGSIISYLFSPKNTQKPSSNVYNFIDSFSFTAKFILIFIVMIPMISVFILTPLWNVIKNVLTNFKRFKHLSVYSVIPHYAIGPDNGFMTVLLFFMESFLFGLCGIIPTLLMIKNRDPNADLTSDESKKTLLEMAAVMVYVSIIFQVSGFYGYIGLNSNK